MGVVLPPCLRDAESTIGKTLVGSELGNSMFDSSAPLHKAGGNSDFQLKLTGENNLQAMGVRVAEIKTTESMTFLERMDTELIAVI